MDYDRILARVAKAYMLIWGDGRSNIAVADSLNENYWDQATSAKFTTGVGKSRRLNQFDVIVTNPPFAGDIKSEDTLSKFEVAFRTLGGKRNRHAQVSRDKLFVERCINFLKPGGRMAIVLPRGLLKNYNDESIRRYILMESRVVAVIGLSGDMFKPYTNTKTCVLILQKRKKRLSNIKEADKDGPIAFCQTTLPGKDRSGRLVYGDDGQVLSDLPQIAAFLKDKVVWL
jgi:type I restriction enzyme M protein